MKTSNKSIWTKTVDKWGRIMLPAKALRAIGAEPQGQVFDSKTPDKRELFVTLGEPNPCNTYTTRSKTVDCYRNAKVRVGKPGDEYTVAVEGKIITVEPA